MLTPSEYAAKRRRELTRARQRRYVERRGEKGVRIGGTEVAHGTVVAQTEQTETE